jgi:hypothetical protein
MSVKLMVRERWESQSSRKICSHDAAGSGGSQGERRLEIAVERK